MSKISVAVLTTVILIAPLVAKSADGLDDQSPRPAHWFEAPQEFLGSSFDSVHNALGSAAAHETTKTPNRHHPSVIDLRHTLQTDAITVVVVEATSSNKSFLERVTINAEQETVPMLAPLGADSEFLVEVLGSPWSHSANELVYLRDKGSGNDRLVLVLQSNLLVRVEWFFHID